MGVGIEVRHGGSGGGGSGLDQLTGDVTAGPGTGAQAATIPNDTVTNAKAANMAQSTIKGRAVAAGTGDPTDLTATQATAILDNMGGDAGAGGLKGLVPAQAAGDAAALKFLKADGTWAVPAGTVLLTFSTIQTPAGTSPVADGATDTLTLASTDLDITGNSGTDTVTIDVKTAAITNAKRANMAQSTISGRAAAAGTGVPTDLTPAQVVTLLALTEQISININGNGDVLQTGIVPGADWRAPYACTITGWYLFADLAGSMVVDIWKLAFASYPPLVANTITAAAKPTLSTALTNSNTSLGTWTVSIAAGDVLRFNVDSATTVTSATLQLIVTRT